MAASWQIDISACNPLIEIISREGRTALPDVVGGWYHDLLREARIIDVNDRAMRLVGGNRGRSEEHTSELQSLMRISYAVFCLKTKTQNKLHSYVENKIIVIDNSIIA